MIFIIHAQPARMQEMPLVIVSIFVINDGTARFCLLLRLYLLKAKKKALAFKDSIKPHLILISINL